MYNPNIENEFTWKRCEKNTQLLRIIQIQKNEQSECI